MDRKIIFIDIDGTLVTHLDGKAYIPESAKNAIKQARANGHFVYLCTGRSKAEIGDIMNIGFDGVIGAAGGYIECGNSLLYHKHMDETDVREMQDYFEKEDVFYYLECNSGLFTTKSFIDYMINDMGFSTDSDFLKIMKDQSMVDYHDVNKISFLSRSLSYEMIYNKYHENFYVVESIWPNTSLIPGEISLPGINKATAIQYLLNHLNLDMEKTYAFGDSMNDLEMFQCVKHPIAMGNASEAIKKHACFVTKDAIADGIEYGMKQFKLI